jgi:ParB/RepB/Spo0J family partition protein
MAEEAKIEARATARSVPVAELGTTLARARCLRSGQLERMKQSLVAHGQLTPLVVVQRQAVLEIVDGFKRRAAAAAMDWPTLLVGVRPLDETAQWVTMLALNRGPQSMTVLEEALVLREMSRAGHSQQEIAGLVGRHKSWVSRRIGLIERLHPELVEWVRTGLLSPGTARRLMVLPAGNQLEWAAVVSQTSLGTEETELLVGLWQKTSDPEVRRFLLGRPREALAQARPESPTTPTDPRLTPRGQGLQRSLRILQTVGQRAEHALRPPPPPRDLELLRPELATTQEVLHRLQEAAGSVARPSGCADSGAPSATPRSGSG